MSGRLRFAGVFGAVALACAVNPGAAQAQTLGRLLACSDIRQAEERLQCYDAAARSAIGLTPARPQPPADGNAGDGERVRALEARIRELEAGARTKHAGGDAAAAAAAAAAATAEREAAIAAREAALKEREEQLAAVAQTRETAEEEATLFGIPIPFTKKDRFNQVENMPGQAIERDADGVVDAITVKVAEFSYTADRKLILVLENGQVWRQMQGEELHLKAKPETPHTVRISRGTLGSFDLKINESNRVVKVRRIDGSKAKR